MKVIIEEQLTEVVGYVKYNPNNIKRSDYERFHYDILEVIDTLVEWYNFTKQEAIIFSEKNRIKIVELMTLNGLNPYDTINTIRGLNLEILKNTL